MIFLSNFGCSLIVLIYSKGFYIPGHFVPYPVQLCVSQSLCRIGLSGFSWIRKCLLWKRMWRWWSTVQHWNFVTSVSGSVDFSWSFKFDWIASSIRSQVWKFIGFQFFKLNWNSFSILPVLTIWFDCYLKLVWNVKKLIGLPDQFCNYPMKLNKRPAHTRTGSYRLPWPWIAGSGFRTCSKNFKMPFL